MGLECYDIDANELEKLKAFQERDGFLQINEEELIQINSYFQQFPLYESIVPILGDGCSNYWCVYVASPLKGMVCYLSHDEVNLEPRFKNISHLLQAITTHPDVYDFIEFDENAFDFPKKELLDFIGRQAILGDLLKMFSQENDEEKKQQLAFSMMALTLKSEIPTFIYPFLEDEDMYIQERAIWFLGFHAYTPAKERLLELSTTAMPNGRLSAQIALKKIS